MVKKKPETGRTLAETLIADLDITNYTQSAKGCVKLCLGGIWVGWADFISFVPNTSLNKQQSQLLISEPKRFHFLLKKSLAEALPEAEGGMRKASRVKILEDKLSIAEGKIEVLIDIVLKNGGSAVDELARLEKKWGASKEVETINKILLPPTKDKQYTSDKEEAKALGL